MKSLILSIVVVLTALLLSVSFGQEQSDELSLEPKASPIEPAKEVDAPANPTNVPAQPDQPAKAKRTFELPPLDSPASENPAAPSPMTITPEPSIPFRAVIYVIEADWSKANNKEQAWAELKAAFKELKLSKAEEAELFTKAPQILFGSKGVSLYKPDHAWSLITWMAHQGLITAVLESSSAKVIANQRTLSPDGRSPFPEGQLSSTPEVLPKPEISMSPGDIGVVVRDQNDAVPIAPPSQFNLGELSFRAFRQVWWFQLNHRKGVPVIDSKLFFEKKSDQLEGLGNDANRSIVMEEQTPVDIIDLPRNEVAFFNAFSTLTVDDRRQTNQRLTRHFDYAKQKGVFAVVAISQGFEVHDAKPEVRLPDRVDVMRHSSEAISSKVQLSPIDVPLSQFFSSNELRQRSDSTPAPPAQAPIARVAPHESALSVNVELVNGTLEIVRKRYLEAEARAIALAQKHVTEPVDKELFSKAVAETFALRQEVHRLELDQLRGRTEAMEQKIRARDARKAQIIERRVEELMTLGKDWQSPKSPDAEMSARTAPARAESNLAAVVPPRAQGPNTEKFNGELQQRLLSELLQQQSTPQPPVAGAKMGTVIDMSDKRQWARPTKAPAPVSDQEEIDAKKARSVENLQKLMRALLDYEKEHGRLPPAVVERTVEGKGAVRHSWRVEILPYLGLKELHDAYKTDEPWDSAANLKVLEQMPDVFASPMDEADSTNSSYFGLVTPGLGPATFVRGRKRNGDNDLPDFNTEQIDVELYQNGTVFSNPKGTRLDAITDGPHRSIALIELKQSIPWTQPLDLEISRNPNLLLSGSWYDDGWHVVYVDGTVRQLSKENPVDEMLRLFRINDNDQIEPKVILPGSKRRRENVLPPPVPGQTLPLY